MYQELQKRLYLTIMALLCVVVVGTFGYKFFGGAEWTYLDALYMTIITITTVGYGEIHNLESNQDARLFTIFILLVGMALLLYGIGNATAFIIEGNLSSLIWRRRIMKKINKMKDHIIVCGAGEIGMNIIDELLKTDYGAVCIERDPAIVETLKNKDKLLIIQGDATDDDVLIEAGIENAFGIISTFSSDKENLFVTVSARQLSPKIRIVTQAVDPTAQKKLYRGGANSVVSTNFIGAMRLTSEMVRPSVVNFLDQMLRVKESTIRIEEVTIPENSRYIGKNLIEAGIGKETGVLVIAIRNLVTNQFIYSFTPENRLKGGDILVVIGSVEQVKKLRKLLDS